MSFLAYLRNLWSALMGKKRPPTFEARVESANWYVVKIGGNGEIEDTSEQYGGPKSRDRGRQGARLAAKRKAAEIPGAKWRVRKPTITQVLGPNDGSMGDHLN